mgnify:CR=1 FL=1
MTDIEKELQIIKDRNRRVEMDKAWEISWTRRLFIVVLTYAVASVWLVLINETVWYLKAFVPVAGYILSTLSLPALARRSGGVKRWWVGNK